MKSYNSKLTAAKTSNQKNTTRASKFKMAKEEKIVIKVRGHTVRSLSWEWAGRRNHAVEAWTANNKYISTQSLSFKLHRRLRFLKRAGSLCALWFPLTSSWASFDFPTWSILAVCFSEGDAPCACARVLACSCMLRLLHAEWILLAAFVISVFTVHSTWFLLLKTNEVYLLQCYHFINDCEEAAPGVKCR